MTDTAPDYDEIVRVIHLYTNGFSTREGGPAEGPDPVRVEMLREAFHEEAWMFFNGPDGVLHNFRIWDFIERFASNRHPRQVTARIISVTQAGDVASVLLGFDDASGIEESWVDCHALLRIDGVWKITNKTATHATRAAWAADRQVELERAPVA
jgi:hypothetical protein